MPSEAMSDPAQTCPKCQAACTNPDEWLDRYPPNHWQCNTGLDGGTLQISEECYERQLAALRAQLAGAERKLQRLATQWRDLAKTEAQPAMYRWFAGQLDDAIAALSGALHGPTPAQLADCEARLARIGQEFLEGMAAAPPAEGGGT